MSDASPGTIRRAVVIGAGTMGAAIAAHLANAGLTVHLLDLTRAALTPEEAEAGLTLADRNVRNRIVNAGFQRMLAARPASLFAPSVADQIHLGNLEDDLATALADADWIIEAIVEQLAPKQELMARIEEAVNRAGLSEREREYVRLRYFENRSMLSVCQRLYVSPATGGRIREKALYKLGRKAG